LLHPISERSGFDLRMVSPSVAGDGVMASSYTPPLIPMVMNSRTSSFTSRLKLDSTEV
jgi:hypothetical protein